MQVGKACSHTEFHENRQIGYYRGERKDVLLYLWVYDDDLISVCLNEFSGQT